MIRWLLPVVSTLYPFLWYWGGARGFFPYLVGIMSVLWLWRAWQAKAAFHRMSALLLGLFFAVVGLSGRQDAMYWYPVWVNLFMLFVFTGSLFTQQSMIERFARLREPDLPWEAVAYTRKVTQIWCLFFAANGSVAAFLAAGGFWQLWAWYTGVAAYVLMGLLFSGEWLYRHGVLKKKIRRKQEYRHESAE